MATTTKSLLLLPVTVCFFLLLMAAAAAAAAYGDQEKTVVFLGGIARCKSNTSMVIANATLEVSINGTTIATDKTTSTGRYLLTANVTSTDQLMALVSNEAAITAPPQSCNSVTVPANPALSSKEKQLEAANSVTVPANPSLSTKNKQLEATITAPPQACDSVTVPVNPSLSPKNKQREAAITAPPQACDSVTVPANPALSSNNKQPASGSSHGEHNLQDEDVVTVRDDVMPAQLKVLDDLVSFDLPAYDFMKVINNLLEIPHVEHAVN